MLRPLRLPVLWALGLSFFTACIESTSEGTIDGAADAVLETSADAAPDAQDGSLGTPLDAFPDAPEASACWGASPETGPCCEELVCFAATAGHCPTTEQAKELATAEPGSCACGVTRGPFAGSSEKPCCYLVNRQSCS